MTIWIDAEAFVEALNRSSVWGWSTEQDETAHKWVFGEIEKFLNDTESQLVKCEDCKYWQDNNGGYPNPDCRWNEQETPDADDFCSFGERREP